MRFIQVVWSGLGLRPKHYMYDPVTLVRVNWVVRSTLIPSPCLQPNNNIRPKNKWTNILCDSEVLVRLGTSCAVRSSCAARSVCATGLLIRVDLLCDQEVLCDRLTNFHETCNLLHLSHSFQFYYQLTQSINSYTGFQIKSINTFLIIQQAYHRSS